MTCKNCDRLLELVEDLRCYTHDWDWKYGEEWDRELAEIKQSIQPQEPDEDDFCERCQDSGEAELGIQPDGRMLVGPCPSCQPQEHCQTCGGKKMMDGNLYEEGIWCVCRPHKQDKGE